MAPRASLGKCYVIHLKLHAYWRVVNSVQRKQGEAFSQILILALLYIRVHPIKKAIGIVEYRYSNIPKRLLTYRTFFRLVPW